jgi:hypothetical protein
MVCCDFQLGACVTFSFGEWGIEYCIPGCCCVVVLVHLLDVLCRKNIFRLENPVSTKEPLLIVVGCQLPDFDREGEKDRAPTSTISRQADSSDRQTRQTTTRTDATCQSAIARKNNNSTKTEHSQVAKQMHSAHICASCENYCAFFLQAVIGHQNTGTTKLKPTQMFKVDYNFIPPQ